MRLRQDLSARQSETRDTAHQYMYMHMCMYVIDNRRLDTIGRATFLKFDAEAAGKRAATRTALPKDY